MGHEGGTTDGEQCLLWPPDASKRCRLKIPNLKWQINLWLTITNMFDDYKIIHKAHPNFFFFVFNYVSNILTKVEMSLLPWSLLAEDIHKNTLMVVLWTTQAGLKRVV